MYVCVKCNVKTMISRIWLNPRKMLVSSINYPYIYKIFFVRPSQRIQKIPMRTERWYSSVIHLSTMDNPETADSTVLHVSHLPSVSIFYLCLSVDVRRYEKYI